MAAVKTRAQEQQSSTPGETTGKLGSVTVTISNTTLSGKDVDGKDVPASMQGTFIAETMPLNENTTMMGVIFGCTRKKRVPMGRNRRHDRNRKGYYLHCGNYQSGRLQDGRVYRRSGIGLDGYAE